MTSNCYRSEWRIPGSCVYEPAGSATAAGQVASGSVGSSDRQEFKVCGETVSRAFRLEAYCREVDRSILLDAQVASCANGLALERFADIRFRAQLAVKRSIRLVRTKQEYSPTDAVQTRSCLMFPRRWLFKANSFMNRAASVWLRSIRSANPIIRTSPLTPMV